ncbi:TPA: TIGR04190 family B12-binding domain/radical SAM domain protein, partial [Candidatus Bathyarchaeota archaeon]|nr:TIGR04190 family B12-binding domain/radical SAM domain protein [Candidatus Bathyarchaeota archaeon]
MGYDLILIHPPTVYDFREEERHYGPVGDLVPASPIFDLYPIGFLSMLTYLAKRGFKVKIVNLAANMLLDPQLDVEETIRKLDAPIYGIDLHWLPHVQGAIEVARLVKRHHPNSKVMLGGLSSTIFWEEILKNHDFIDLVALGDTVEKPV